jgi:hypothetical protein
MYEFIYDQQNIYNYYDEKFEEKNKSLNYTINARQPMGVFGSALESFDDLLPEFFDEKEMQLLANIRWYNLNSSLEYYDGKQNKMHIEESGAHQNDDISTIFSSNCSETISTKLIEEYQIKNNNNLLSLLNSIILSTTFFCKLSYNYIMKYFKYDHLYLDCYIKRVNFI